MSGEILNKRIFIDEGCQNWKKIQEKMLMHNDSARHKNSTCDWVYFRKIQNNSSSCIASVLDVGRNAEVLKNREHNRVLLAVPVTSLLGRHGIAFRGHREDESSSNLGNFKETMNSFAQFNVDLKQSLERRYTHYTYPAYQDDFIKIFGDKILAAIVTDIKKAVFFTIMCDETKDNPKRNKWLYWFGII